MSLRVKALLLVAAVLVVAVGATTVVLTVNASQAVLSQAREDGLQIARLLARSAAFAEEVPKRVETALGEQMIVQARALAEYVGAAEHAGQTSEQITTHLRRLLAGTKLAEVWITDEHGHAYLHTTPGIDFTFSPDLAKQPQAGQFYPLLSGAKESVVQEARRREVDAQVMKYVGVRGVDKPRIVQVGMNAEVLTTLGEQVGLDSLTKELIRDGTALSVRFVNGQLVTLAYGAVPGEPHDAFSSADDQQHVQEVIKQRAAVSYQRGWRLKVMAPVLTTGGRVSGVTMVVLPMQHAHAAAIRDVFWALGLGALIMLLSVALATVLVQRVVADPLERVTKEAREVAAGDYETTGLADIAQRPDELGQLASAFVRMADEVEQREHKLVQAKLETIERLVLAAEYKDRDTAAHIQRMSHFSAVLARRAGLSAAEAELLLQAAPMHDVGKMGIPDAILLKPGKLDEEEWRVMRSHTILGANMLRGSVSELLQAGEVIALSHHEKWDGSGYPYGLKGTDIPLWGRICAVADVFDALTSVRPYKVAYTSEEAAAMMRETAGRHFDPDLLELFLGDLSEIEEIRRRFREAPIESQLAPPTSELAPFGNRPSARRGVEANDA